MSHETSGVVAGSAGGAFSLPDLAELEYSHCLLTRSMAAWMITTVSKSWAGGCFGETSSPSCHRHPPLVFFECTTANVSKIGQLGFLSSRRTTHVCFSPSGDGWFQGLLATEKKRPCTETLLVRSQERTEQASKFSRLRVGSRSHNGAYVRVQLDCGASRLTHKRPSLLRACRNRRSKYSLPLKSRGNAPLLEGI
jgi:hypothetical protein